MAILYVVCVCVWAEGKLHSYIYVLCKFSIMMITHMLFFVVPLIIFGFLPKEKPNDV